MRPVKVSGVHKEAALKEMAITGQQKRMIVLAWVPILLLPLAMLGFSGPCTNLHGLGGAVWVFLISAGCLLSEIRVVRLLKGSSGPSNKMGWLRYGISFLPVLPVTFVAGFFLLMTVIETPILVWYTLKGL